MVDDKTPVEDAADEIAEDVATFAKAVAAAVGAGATLFKHLKNHWGKLTILTVFLSTHAGRDAAEEAWNTYVGGILPVIECTTDGDQPPTSCVTQKTHNSVIMSLSQGHTSTIELLDQCRVALKVVCPE